MTREEFRNKIRALKDVTDREEYAQRLIEFYLEDALSLDTLFFMAMNFGQQYPNWISVEEELPPRHKNVLVHRQNGELMTAKCGDDNAWRSSDGYPINNNITHWMPLPSIEGISGNQGKISPNENDMDYALEKRNNEVCLYFIRNGKKMGDISLTWEQAKELHRQMAQLLYYHKFESNVEQKAPFKIGKMTIEKGGEG